ncbi:cytochrome c biogenesis CcdA family protein [Nocardioides sp.]|uniref:cytochrome c biogenesis CcdA family protein n=1 Tax=Nocardioides sp. TaxID=35761 RepID=UPI002EDB23D0
MNPADFIERLSGSVAQYPVVALLVAVAGGLFSTSTCPCTLPAGIGIVGYVGTHAHAGGPAGRWSGGRALSLAFFLGLVLSITALGIGAAMVGRLLTQWGPAFAVGAAVLTAAAGAATLLAPALRRRLPDPEIRKRGGITGAFVYGVLYSVATVTTSAGPLLLLLTVAAAIGRPAYGAGLSFAYSLGRGLPFLALGLFAGRLGAWLRRVERARRPAEVVSGVALLGLAVYFVRLATVLA